MKLGTIYDSIETWKKLCNIDLPAQIAYKVAKFIQQLSPDAELAEKQRVKAIYEAAGVPEGQEVNLKLGTPEYAKFINKWMETCNVDVDTPHQIDVTIEELLGAIGDKGTLSGLDVLKIEPFCKEQGEDKNGEAPGEPRCIPFSGSQSQG